ncbi:hypothetical protein [Mycolicibacterium holsaticum]|uniref:hypothetical protein n=1 Tax=Mycolicibacterium holsaticum TaxID=152142 RepID=UPI001F1F5997|nr:hypothetical protein [Mycolicibacterium holsaticum]
MADLDEVGSSGEHRLEPLAAKVGGHLAAVGAQIRGQVPVEVGGQRTVLGRPRQQDRPWIRPSVRVSS